MYRCYNFIKKNLGSNVNYRSFQRDITYSDYQRNDELKLSIT